MTTGLLTSFACSLSMSFSLFSKIPVPIVDWDKGNMRYVMCCFPLVGLVEGALIALCCLAATWLGLSEVAVAAVMTIVPILVTGGIHLDGFCDVSDALSSYAAPERRREILKDPHVGAFAVIACGCYLLAHLCVSLELASFVREGCLALLGRAGGTYGVAPLVLACLVCVLSRCCSGIATLAFPKSADKGMLSMFAEGADTVHALVALVVMLLVAVAAAVWTLPVAGLAMACVAVGCLAWVWHCSMRRFGGMSGDLAGWYLQVAELGMLVALLVVLRLMCLGLV